MIKEGVVIFRDKDRMYKDHMYYYHIHVKYNNITILKSHIKMFINLGPGKMAITQI